MTIQEIKQTLREARKAGLAYKELKSKASEYEQRLMCGKSVTYTTDGGTKERSGNSVERSLCNAADYAAEAAAAGKALTEPYIKAGRLIYLVRDDKLREVLNRYYLHCQSWEKIAADLGYSRQWINRLHGYALKKISEST